VLSMRRPQDSCAGMHVTSNIQVLHPSMPRLNRNKCLDGNTAQPLHILHTRKAVKTSLTVAHLAPQVCWCCCCCERLS